MFRQLFFLALLASGFNQINAQDVDPDHMQTRSILASLINRHANTDFKIADKVDHTVNSAKDVVKEGGSAFVSSLKDVGSAANKSLGSTKDFIKSGFNVGKDYLNTAVQIVVIPAKTTNAVVHEILSKLKLTNKGSAGSESNAVNAKKPHVTFIDSDNNRLEFYDEEAMMILAMAIQKINKNEMTHASEPKSLPNPTA